MLCKNSAAQAGKPHSCLIDLSINAPITNRGSSFARPLAFPHILSHELTHIAWGRLASTEPAKAKLCGMWICQITFNQIVIDRTFDGTLALGGSDKAAHVISNVPVTPAFSQNSIEALAENAMRRHTGRFHGISARNHLNVKPCVMLPICGDIGSWRNHISPFRIAHDQLDRMVFDHVHTHIPKLYFGTNAHVCVFCGAFPCHQHIRLDRRVAAICDVHAVFVRLQDCINSGDKRAIDCFDGDAAWVIRRELVFCNREARIE
mmetsp:Transcript_59647/g.98958  ORF Transcript_59647/g.98958 Transcript_59647/m.98958 type:complete len:262 (+) Transcript_59647:160-945(+)